VTDILDVVTAKNLEMTKNSSSRKREEERLAVLQSEWDLRSEKIRALREALAIEADPARKFQLKEQIKVEDLQQESLSNEMEHLRHPENVLDRIKPLSATSPEQLGVESRRGSTHSTIGDRLVAYVFAAPVLAALIYLVLNPQLVSSGTLAIIRFLAAVFAGISAYSFTGTLGLEAKIPFSKTQLKATGAFAAFIIVLLIFFYGIPIELKR
jgi:hypothetical protein